MNSATLVSIIFLCVESCIALLAHSEDPRIEHQHFEEARFEDRHYVKACARPSQHHIHTNDVTLFGGPPRTLWQTEKKLEKDLPDVVTSMRNKWSHLNRDIEMKYMSDEEALAFVEANFDKSVLDAFRGFPLGVMRADFWRYLVVYTYGGVYADVDVEPSKPIRDWLSNGNNFNPATAEQNWRHCSMVVGQENAVDISQWTFAATPKHPALKVVIDLIVDRYKAGVDTNYTHFVHYHTGPAVFTAGIHMYASQTSTECKVGPAQSWVISGTQICVLRKDLFYKLITNHYGSINANFSSVLGSWTDERDHILDSKKREMMYHPNNVPCRCTVPGPAHTEEALRPGRGGGRSRAHGHTVPRRR
jgi:mannosyltransferase OCH1-like enzyme